MDQISVVSGMASPQPNKYDHNKTLQPSIRLYVRIRTEINRITNKLCRIPNSYAFRKLSCATKAMILSFMCECESL
jgi:hypothetical protein